LFREGNGKKDKNLAVLSIYEKCMVDRIPVLQMKEADPYS
jgi:hypothetical protein